MFLSLEAGWPGTVLGAPAWMDSEPPSPRLGQAPRVVASGPPVATPSIFLSERVQDRRRPAGTNSGLEQVAGWLTAAGYRPRTMLDEAGRSVLAFEMDRRPITFSFEPLSGWCAVRLLELERPANLPPARATLMLAAARANRALRFASVRPGPRNGGPIEAIVRAPAVEHLFTRADLEVVLAELSRSVRIYSTLRRAPEVEPPQIGRRRLERPTGSPSSVLSDRLETMARWIRQDCALPTWIADGAGGSAELEIDLSARAVARLCLDERGLSVNAVIAIVPTTEALAARLEALVEATDPSSLTTFCLDGITNTITARVGLPLFGNVPDADLVTRVVGDLDRVLASQGSPRGTRERVSATC
jgi:hypothetical protein